MTIMSKTLASGRPFMLDGRMFRPAQDCSETYGGAVNVMEIVELSPTVFREVHATRLEADPSWPYPHGLHHLVVDGNRRPSRLSGNYRLRASCGADDSARPGA